MASHGQKETATLQKNLQAQLDRLLLQLEVRKLDAGCLAEREAFSVPPCSTTGLG